jgi:hypothetical protein
MQRGVNVMKKTQDKHQEAKRLALHSETVRSLKQLELANIVGGKPNPTLPSCIYCDDVP